MMNEREKLEHAFSQVGQQGVASFQKQASSRPDWSQFFKQRQHLTELIEAWAEQFPLLDLYPNKAQEFAETLLADGWERK
jgi:hypothetical protein